MQSVAVGILHLDSVFINDASARYIQGKARQKEDGVLSGRQDRVRTKQVRVFFGLKKG